MIQSDEISSSLKDEPNKLSLISFVGFQEHLVINFLRTFISNGVREVLLFSSKMEEAQKDRLGAINLYLRKKAVQFVRDSLGYEVRILLIEIDNIWDFQNYYVRLSQEPIEKAIINISAGPAVFAAAGIIWAVENNHDISYSVEYHNEGKLVSSVFNLVDLRPYVDSIFSTDNVDKMIIKALKNGEADTLQIYRYINETLKYRISLRSVEIHLIKLNKWDIVDITKAKVNKISLSENWSKVGSAFEKSRRMGRVL